MPDANEPPASDGARELLPDNSRPGIFANHNCWKCKDGADLSKCPTPNRPGNCGYPHARND